ncbi:MAG: sugar phosphate nucleotidyltransferase [Candidatus Avigastranaerophilus sp.]
MINKVDSVNLNLKLPNVKKVETKPVQGTQTSYTKELSGAKYVSMYQAMNGVKAPVSFGAKTELTEYENSFIGNKEIRIPNLLDLKENLDIPFKLMPKGTEHLNTAGLNVEKTVSGTEELYKISNDKGNRIFEGVVDRAKMSALPEVTYKQGKFMPEITVKDPSLDGKAVKMLAGSSLEGEGFKFHMIGDYTPTFDAPAKNVGISFKGRTVITTLNKEDRTLKAVDAYKESGLQSQAVKGDYYDMMKEDDPTIVIPAGGFGERFFNITRENENKPSAKLPTDERFRIIGTTLNLAASAGIMTGDDDDKIIYLSQAHEIEDGEKVRHTSKYKTDGGAIAEGLRRDLIRNDKASVILNADIFTNADITRTYNALKTLPNAALVIPYYPVNAQRAKAFGLLGIEKDANGNLQIKEFLEKPKYTSEAPIGTDFVSQGEYDKAMENFKKVQTAVNPDDENTFLANPGFYFLSPQAQKVLMAKGILEPNATGLGAHVMPKIVELANNGDLLDDEGNQMKVYTVPLETKGGKPAVWDDIGTAEAYLKLIKDVGHEYRTHGNTSENKYYGIPEFVMKDFANNTDPETGIVYASQDARGAFDNFCSKFGVDVAEGNIFVAGK